MSYYYGWIAPDSYGASDGPGIAAATTPLPLTPNPEPEKMTYGSTSPGYTGAYSSAYSSYAGGYTAGTYASTYASAQQEQDAQGVLQLEPIQATNGTTYETYSEWNGGYQTSPASPYASVANPNNEIMPGGSNGGNSGEGQNVPTTRGNSTPQKGGGGAGGPSGGSSGGGGGKNQQQNPKQKPLVSAKAPAKNPVSGFLSSLLGSVAANNRPKQLPAIQTLRPNVRANNQSAGNAAQKRRVAAVPNNSTDINFTPLLVGGGIVVLIVIVILIKN